MESTNNSGFTTEVGLLKDIQTMLHSVQSETRHLATVVANLDKKVTHLAEPKAESKAGPKSDSNVLDALPQASSATYSSTTSVHKLQSPVNPGISLVPVGPASTQNQSPPGRSPNAGLGNTSRIILTTYPGQSGISPVVMNWGHEDPEKRGPVIVSRDQSTVRRRNGTPSGSACHH